LIHAASLSIHPAAELIDADAELIFPGNLRMKKRAGLSGLACRQPGRQEE
jgi:hypothetical protein